MCNLLFNIRFGSKHWQLTRDWKMSWVHNPAHDERDSNFKWFAVYTAFGESFN